MSAQTAPRPVALVTGAAQRIGRHIACTLAENGWDVAVHYRNSVEQAAKTLTQLKTIGGRHELFQADLADEADTRRLFADVLVKLGRVDAVINNASVFEHDDALTFHTGRLQEHMLPNVAAPLLLAQDLYQHVCARGTSERGVVVNLLDQKLRNPNPDFLSYTLSKAALQTATVLLAKALAPQIRVVAVSPGLTLPSHLQTDEAFEKTHRLAPLGQASNPSDIARTVLFLLQSPSITGVDLPVDGGQHLVGMDRDFSMMEL